MLSDWERVGITVARAEDGRLFTDTYDGDGIYLGLYYLTESDIARIEERVERLTNSVKGPVVATDSKTGEILDIFIKVEDTE